MTLVSPLTIRSSWPAARRKKNRDILTRLLQGKGEAAHEAAVAANVAMLMRLYGHEDLKANAQRVIDVLRSGRPMTE